MRLLHLSDLHLTRYGEGRRWKQSTQTDDEDWELQHSWRRWRIEGRRDKKKRPERLRLLDPAGMIHGARKWTQRDDKTISSLLARAMERQATSAEELAKNQPTREDLASLLRVNPNNTNLRFLEIVQQVLPLEPELVAITGDLTDNGFGYQLVEHYFAPWIKKERLIVVPGNHDTYEMFPGKFRKARLEAKLQRYQQFAEAIDMAPEGCGAFARRIGDLAFVGLSSCKPPRTLLSASGEVTNEQLRWMESLVEDPDFRDARLRICLLHHHLLRMPFEFGKGSSMEVGLRLRNAREVMAACINARIDIILNGHKHHGYMVKMPGHPTVVSSPSSTLGCKSTDMRYVWMMDLAAKHPHPVAHRFTTDRATSDRDREHDDD
jgi:Icc protein